jgi:hypothetical protein
MRQRRRDGTHVRVHVRFERPIELLVRDVFGPFFPILIAGVAHQDVEASQLADGALNHRAAERSVGEIALEDHAPPALGLDGVSSFGSVPSLFRQCRDCDIGPFAREQQGHGSSDARVAAGNERRLSFQLSRGSIRSCFISGPRSQVRFEAGLGELLGRKRRRWLQLNLRFAHRSDCCNIQTAICVHDRRAASERLAESDRFGLDQFVESFIECPDVGALAAAEVPRHRDVRHGLHALGAHARTPRARACFGSGHEKAIVARMMAPDKSGTPVGPAVEAASATSGRGRCETHARRCRGTRDSRRGR